MVISKKTLNKFQLLKEHGDVSKLSNLSVEILGKRIARLTFQTALEKGKCNENTFKVLDKYYSSKKMR